MSLPGIGLKVELMQRAGAFLGGTTIGEQVDPYIAIDEHRLGMVLGEEIDLTGEAARGHAFRIPPFPRFPHTGDFHHRVLGVSHDGAIDERADGVPTARESAATAAGQEQEGQAQCEKPRHHHHQEGIEEKRARLGR